MAEPLAPLPPAVVNAMKTVGAQHCRLRLTLTNDS
jgi:hypothetical protein